MKLKEILKHSDCSCAIIFDSKSNPLAYRCFKDFNWHYNDGIKWIHDIDNCEVMKMETSKKRDCLYIFIFRENEEVK